MSTQNKGGGMDKERMMEGLRLEIAEDLYDGLYYAAIANGGNISADWLAEQKTSAVVALEELKH